MHKNVVTLFAHYLIYQTVAKIVIWQILKGSHIHCNGIPQDIRSSWFLLIIHEWAQRTSELSSEINEIWYPMVSHYNKYENPFLTQFLNAFDAKIRKPSLFISPLLLRLDIKTFFKFVRSLILWRRSRQAL